MISYTRLVGPPILKFLDKGIVSRGIYKYICNILIIEDVIDIRVRVRWAYEEMLHL